MALTDRQFRLLQDQLQRKKETLGETEYNSFLNRVAATSEATEVDVDSTATFPASPTDTPIQAGLKAAGNVPSSAFGLGKSLFQAVTHPVETTKGLASAITGGGRAIQEQVRKTAPGIFGEALPESERADATFKALKESFVERYGSLDAAQKTATEDPVGFGADVAAIFSGAGITKVVEKVSELNKAAKASIATKVTGKFDDVAIGQMQKAINLNPSDIRKIKQPNIASKDPAEWLLERGIRGSRESIASQLDDIGTASKAQVDNGLAQLTTRVKIDNALPAQKTLDVLIKDLDGVIGMETTLDRLTKMRGQTSFSIAELNEIKRLGDDLSAIYKTTGIVKDSAKAQGLANVRSELKTLIENEASKQGFDAVKALNKETQVSFEISKALKKRLDVESKLPELGLRDGVLAVGGFATGGPLAAAGIVISKKILESAQFRTFLANKLKGSNTAQKVELQKALETRNYTVIFQYLAPIVNEYEVSQSQE